MLTSVLSKLTPNRRQRIYPEIYFASSPVVKDARVKVKDPCVKVKDPCVKVKDPPRIEVNDDLCVKIYAKCQERGAYEKYKMELNKP